MEWSGALSEVRVSVVLKWLGTATRRHATWSGMSTKIWQLNCEKIGGRFSSCLISSRGFHPKLLNSQDLMVRTLSLSGSSCNASLLYTCSMSMVREPSACFG